jgi:hypothetical protein
VGSLRIDDLALQPLLSHVGRDVVDHGLRPFAGGIAVGLAF